MHQSQPGSPVLRLFAQSSILCQVVLDAVHPPLLRSSFPDLSRHIHHIISYSHILLLFSIPLKPSFLDFLGYFSNFSCHSNSLIPYSVKLCDFTNPVPHISATFNFFSCACFLAHVSVPYNVYIIADLTTGLGTFPSILTLILQTHINPDILF